MGLPFFVNCSFLIQRAIYFETAPFMYRKKNMIHDASEYNESICSI